MADGSGRSLEMRVYANPILEAMRAAITDAEVTDNVGRARAVNRKSAAEGVHVYLLTDVVTALPVSNLIGWDNVRLSIHARMAARGCIFGCPADAHRAYPTLFPTLGAAQTAMKRDRKQSGTSSYDFIHKTMYHSGRFCPVH
jgi:hypothetical protein